MERGGPGNQKAVKPEDAMHLLLFATVEALGGRRVQNVLAHRVLFLTAVREAEAVVNALAPVV